MSQEIRLRCLEMAVDRARHESAEKFQDRVAELQDWFYDRVVVGVSGTASPEPDRNPQQPRHPDKKALIR